MKKLFLSIAFIVTFNAAAFAQEDDAISKATELRITRDKEIKTLQAKLDAAKKAVKEAERAERAAERAYDQAEKERKRAEKREDQIRDLKEDIADQKDDIAKYEHKVIEMQSDMDQDIAKGKLSPNDIEKENKKIDRVKAKVIREKEELRKLERKN